MIKTFDFLGPTNVILQLFLTLEANSIDSLETRVTFVSKPVGRSGFDHFEGFYYLHRMDMWTLA